MTRANMDPPFFLSWNVDFSFNNQKLAFLTQRESGHQQSLSFTNCGSPLQRETNSSSHPFTKISRVGFLLADLCHGHNLALWSKWGRVMEEGGSWVTIWLELGKKQFPREGRREAYRTEETTYIMKLGSQGATMFSEHKNGIWRRSKMVEE